MISVVIPTRNRLRALERTLRALALQEAADFEVVVADNASTDETASLIADVARDVSMAFELVTEPKPGPAAARNRAVEQASGEVLLFLGDDTEPADKAFVAAHAARHAARPEPLYAVLGHIEWSPRITVTPFMRWLEHGGPQFSFGRLVPGAVSVAKHFYTSNVSLKTRVFRETGGFDESFPFAAVEDIELGVRLEALGVELEYDPTIVAYHDHPTTLADSLERLVRVGRSARRFHELHPDRRLRELPVPAHPAAVRALRPVATALGRDAAPRPLRELAWTLLHSDSYSRGYALGLPSSGS